MPTPSVLSLHAAPSTLSAAPASTGGAHAYGVSGAGHGVTRRHEIPTHLAVEDRVLLGLTLRQVMFLMAGCAAAYGLWGQWPHLPLAPRCALAAVCLALAAAVALCRPGGRALEEWGVATVRYAMLPKRAVWRPCPPLDPPPSRATRWRSPRAPARVNRDGEAEADDGWFELDSPRATGARVPAQPLGATARALSGTTPAEEWA